MFKKKILAFILALLCSFGLVACNTEPPEAEETTAQTTSASQTWETTRKEDKSTIKIVDGKSSEYKIVYSATSDIYALYAAEYISSRIEEATGVKLEIINDNTPPSDREIVIGSTNRDAHIGFDAENYDWETYHTHIGIHGKRLLFTAEKNIDIYRNLSFIMDKWISRISEGTLEASNIICQRMMEAYEVDDNVITILMQNLCTFGDNPNSRAERNERVYKEFQYYDADIIGVSEAIPQWLTYLDGVMIPDGYTRLGGKNILDDGNGDLNNIYYKTEKLNVIDWNTFWYSDTPDIPGTMLNGAEDYKVATWAIFEVKTTGDRFMVLNTHLHAYKNYSYIRTKQIQIFTDFLKPYMSQYPVYVMGDMNIEETHIQYATVLETFYDSRDIARENLSGEQDTYNAYGERESDADYIFTGKDDNQEILWFKVINEKKFGDYSIADNEWLSDHYGIFVQTRIS